MALKLGKKKDADAVVVNEADGTTTVVTKDVNAMPSEDQFADLIPDNLPRKKRGPSPAIFGGAALALVAAAAGAWWMFGRESVEENDSIGVPPTTRVVANPTTGDDRVVITKPVAKPAAGAKPPAKPVVNVDMPGDRPMSRPEKAGIVPPKAENGSPVIAAAQPDSVPRFVPVPNSPTPVPLIRPGMAGKAGRRADRRQVMVVPPGISSDDAAFKAQLKALWNAGAAAKQRGNIEGARNQWQRILELSPGHPGIQEAIDKLSA